MKNGLYQDEFGNKIWYKNGHIHRNDCYAVIHRYSIRNSYDNDSIYRTWCVNDNIHRLDGPAVVSNGYAHWWINGINITD